MPRTFVEPFDQPNRGWIGWNHTGGIPVEVDSGAAVSRSPWWVDFNHAPPGGGYLHILFALHMRHTPANADALNRLAGPNPFILGNYPTDFTNAKVSCRLKGKVNSHGSELVFLVQGKVKSKNIWVAA